MPQIKQTPQEKDIDNLPSGGTIDKMVSDQIFNGSQSRPYSTNIDAAFEVVSMFDHTFQLQRFSKTTNSKDCSDIEEVAFNTGGGLRAWRCRLSLKCGWSYAHTAPLAISRAALKAVLYTRKLSAV
jgi:hypothetical protein